MIKCYNLFSQMDEFESWEKACEKVFQTEKVRVGIRPEGEAQVDERARAYRRSSLQDPPTRGWHPVKLASGLEVGIDDGKGGADEGLQMYSEAERGITIMDNTFNYFKLIRLS